MLARETLINDIRKGLAAFQSYIEPGGKLHLTDINIHAEDFAAALLNAIFGWDLVNANRSTGNYPCIDLIDVRRRLAVQVTSEKGSAKLTDMLGCLQRHHLADHVSKIKVLLLVKKQDSYTVDARCPGIDFDWASDVLDFTDLLLAAQRITELEHLQRVHRCIVDAMPSMFTGPSSSSEFRIHTHHCDATGRRGLVVFSIADCVWHGPAQKPQWIDTAPAQMSDDWIVTKFATGCDLHLYLVPNWCNGTWIVADKRSREGVVINCHQLADLRPSPPTTTTSTTTTGSPTPSTP
jgi:hypothetical protein